MESSPIFSKAHDESYQLQIITGIQLFELLQASKEKSLSSARQIPNIGLMRDILKVRAHESSLFISNPLLILELLEQRGDEFKESPVKDM